MKCENLFEKIPKDLSQEVFEVLAQGGGARIERIVSAGQSAPAEGWFDQGENEWVMVLQGEARLQFEGEEERKLEQGDYLLIPSHTRHRVLSTSKNPETIWLAVHFA